MAITALEKANCTDGDYLIEIVLSIKSGPSSFAQFAPTIPALVHPGLSARGLLGLKGGPVIAWAEASQRAEAR